MRNTIKKLFWKLPLPHAPILRIVRKTYHALRALIAVFRLRARPPEMEIEERHSERKPQVLVFDWSTPRPDKDSGSVDTCNYFRLFQALGFDVTFLPEDFNRQQKYTRSLQQAGVRCIYWPCWRSVKSYLKHQGAEFDVVMLQRAPGAIEHIDKVRSFCTNARIIFNTVDLHYLRETRQAEIENSRAKLRQAAKTKQMESSIMARADATIVISAQEMETVKAEWPHINVVAIPFIREVVPTTTPFEQRKDIFFLGGFLHTPNVDAIHYFVDAIWPLVRPQLPDVRLHIVGSDMPKEIEDLRRLDGIVPVGYVEDLKPTLSQCRLSIAPLRYGAGIKGKIGTSLSHGVPCVATPLAVEGMGLVDGINVRIGEDAPTFANALVELYRDKHAWEALSRNGLDYFEQQYSFASGLARLRSLLRENLRVNMRA
jgi:O-antigen biosynthesis protein